MRQRVVIALALCAEPRLVDRRRADHRARRVHSGADHRAAEAAARSEHGTAVMLVTHDMGVIAETADRVAVMYAGRIAEIGAVREVVRRPLHPLRPGADGRDPVARAARRAAAQIAGAMPRLNAIPRGLRVQSALRARRSRAAAAERPAADRGRRRAPRRAGSSARPA